MGVTIRYLSSFHDRHLFDGVAAPVNPVYHIALHPFHEIVKAFGNRPIAHLISATSCPDQVAPSLGQRLGAAYPENFSASNIIDMVQGCGGGVTALTLGAHLCEMHQQPVAIVIADAAKLAVPSTGKLYQHFSNGAFAAIIEPASKQNSFIKSMVRQYAPLCEMVTITTGHNSIGLIQKKGEDVLKNPRRYLGLSIDNLAAVRLIRQSEKFYLEFIEGTGHPDIMILHQANKLIVGYLKKIFKKYPIEFIDQAEEVGNCGAPTACIVLDRVKHRIEGKRVMVGSFGTGGIIAASLWQF